jgi:ABC-type multidrug transport system ATPase subunit
MSQVVGAHVAVDDVSCAVASGSFFSLLGRRAASKSTTLWMISGPSGPTSARRIAGQDMRTVPPTSA